MEKDQAISLLIDVAKLSQSRGILSLEDAAVVLQAIETLTPKKDELHND
jgi:hypothetical protein